MNLIFLFLTAVNLSSEITIENYLRRNLEVSHEIKKQEEELEYSKRSYIYQLYDMYLPQISYNFSTDLYSDYKKNLSFEKDYSSSYLSISKNIFNNFKDDLNLKNSFINFEISANNLWLAKQEISYGAINTYINYLKAIKLLEVSKLNKKSYEEQYEKTKSYYNEGLRSYSDLLKSELNLKTAELYYLSQQNYLKNSLMNFNYLYYEDPLKEETLSDIVFDENIKIPGETEAVEKALKNRKEIDTLKKNLKIKENEFKKSKINLYPELKLDFSYSRQNILSLSNKKDTNYSLSFSMFYPFGPSELVDKSAQKYRAESELEQLKRKLNETEISIKKEVIAALLSLSYVIKRYEVAKIKIKISRDNLDIIKQKYAEGKASVIDLIDAQKDELDANTEVAESYYELYLSIISLKKAMGEKLWNGE
ncbi:MAG TPA: TolC family protein [Elusimicrobiales bacterium]|nr:TolC family protein [Elusimicrobiales bacterium]